MNHNEAMIIAKIQKIANKHNYKTYKDVGTKRKIDLVCVNDDETIMLEVKRDYIFFDRRGIIELWQS